MHAYTAHKLACPHAQTPTRLHARILTHLHVGSPFHGHTQYTSSHVHTFTSSQAHKPICPHVHLLKRCSTDTQACSHLRAHPHARARAHMSKRPHAPISTHPHAHKPKHPHTHIRPHEDAYTRARIHAKAFTCVPTCSKTHKHTHASSVRQVYHR